MMGKVTGKEVLGIKKNVFPTLILKVRGVLVYNNFRNSFSFSLILYNNITVLH